jgi:hypothetical protein
MKKQFTLIIIVIFVLLTAVFYGINKAVPEYKFSVLMTGNVVMAVLSLVSYFLVVKQMNERPEAFVRGVYAGTFLKLLVCMAAILLYVMLNKPNIHKPSLFVLFGIYAVYTIAETWLLSKIAREAK